MKNNENNENNEINVNKFQTKDLPLIAVLITCNVLPEDIIWINNEAFFVFDDRMKCLEIVQKFYEYKLQLDVHAFSNNLKKVRNIIKSKLNNVNNEYKNENITSFFKK